MTERKQPKIKFVNLHSHTGFSIYDGMSLPAEHMDFAYENGMDAMAITDHGHMNALSYQVLHGKKMNASDKDFKPIFGCEAYFIPSLAGWKEEYQKHLENKKSKKESAEENTGTIIEDESETKSKASTKSLLNKRMHLVVLAMNQKGLNNLYSLVSKSYSADSFYRYPRLDFDMLQEHNEGLIVSSACLGGCLAKTMFEHYDKTDEQILPHLEMMAFRFVSIFGDRFYGELQWNNIPEQHRLNKLIIELSKKMGFKLISTADSHYPTPDSWKDRELYKRLGWMGSKNDLAGESTLPANVDEIGYELYPKNGDQMWDAYKKYSALNGVEYDDDIILSSIEETYRIAHERIDTFWPENTLKLPDFVVPGEQTPDYALHSLVFDAVKSKNITDATYIARASEELQTIKERGFSKYFLAMKKISDEAQNIMLTGSARGSAGGSLVAYLLDITQIDPIKYNLLFSRFLQSAVPTGVVKSARKTKEEHKIKPYAKITCDDGKEIKLTLDSQVKIRRDGKVRYVQVSKLTEQDEIITA